MKTADIARAITQGVQQQITGNSDLGWHSGVVESWDDLSGLNSIRINGNSFENLPVLSTGALLPFTPGDVVDIIRSGRQYFILGKVRAPGAGAGERIAASRVASQQQITSSTFAAAPGPAGPSVTINVGSGGRVLVIHSAEFIVAGAVTHDVDGLFKRGYVFQGVALSGANSYAPEAKVTDAYAKLAFGMEGSYAATTLVTGLSPGQTTFTCLYKSTTDTGITAFVNNRVLTVMPI